MKKQLILGAIVLGFAASSFGQGYAAFYTTGKSWAFDNFSTPGTSQVGGSAGVNMDFALMIGAASTASAIGAGNSTANVTPLAATAWNTILNDPNFSLVNNLSGSSLAVATVNTANLTKGGFSYNVGSSFQIQGWGNSTANLNVSMYVIGWNAAYATPAAAALANSAVGWSSVFQYTLQKDTSTTPSATSAAGLVAFGVTPIVAAPEPSTMALAALGGASLLLFRRRK